MSIRKQATVEVKSNLELTVRERGKIVARRRGHNIWLNLGREYLARLICYTSYSPVTPEEDMRIRYMGLGIGGNRQNALGVANNPPISTAYPGTNSQVDTDPAVQRLERPVRVSGSSTAPPYLAGDVWLGQVQAPVVHPTPTQSLFKRLFTQVEVSYAPFLTVPVSEVGLFTNGTLNDPNYVNVHDNTCVAYDTFDTLSKTDAVEVEVNWTLRM